MEDIVNLAPASPDETAAQPLFPSVPVAAAAPPPPSATQASAVADAHLAAAAHKFRSRFPRAGALVKLPPQRQFSSPFALLQKGNPWWIRASVNGAFLILTGVVLGDTLVTLDLYQKHNRLGGMTASLVSNGIVASNIFLWPILWDLTIGYERMVEQPRISFGFFWPMLISSFDMRYIMDQRAGSGHNMDKLATGLNMDAQAIISAAFAMGALMSSLKSVRGTHIIMYALIMSLALVIPQIATPSDTPDRAIILSAQKAALNDAIGFIVAGIGADFLSGGASKPLFGRM